MKTVFASARRAALPLALAATFASLAQTQLKEVVTATRFALDAATLPVGVSVITAEESQAAEMSTVS